MRRLPRFHLFVFASLFCMVAHAAADTTHVRAFIDNWKRIVADDWINCHYLESFYSDTLNFYNASCSKEEMCIRLTESFPSDAVLVEPGYKVEAAGTTGTWKVMFENALNVYGTDKSHYIIVQEAADSALVIVKHSSLADDRWYARRKAIESNVVNDGNGKRYYVLNEDSITFPGRRLYFLTDTLSFSVPFAYGACQDTFLSYDAVATVFVAMSKKNSRITESICDISKELNAETFEEAQLIQGGFPCFIQKDSADASGMPVRRWSVPEIRWKKTGKHTAVIRLRCNYSYGGGCLWSYTTINMIEKKKKIEVKKVMEPRLLKGGGY